MKQPLLPKKEIRKTITVEIEVSLLDEAKKAAAHRGLTMRDAVHFGLLQFLWATIKDETDKE